MPSEEPRVQVAGSDRDEMPGARVIGAVPLDERIEVTVRVRPRFSAAYQEAHAVASEGIGRRRYLARDELRATLGADPADIAVVRSFAAELGLEVVEA